jgi:RNA polymerase sigma-70 factor (ECF subfamily)
VEPVLAQWLYTVCRNLAIDARRRSSRMHTIELPPSLNGRANDDPAVRVEQRDSQSRAMDLMAHLPPNQQEALRLKFQHSLTYKEIAAVMGESESNVGWLIHSGLKTLRMKMQPVRT